MSYESLRRGRNVQNHLEPLRAANGDIVGIIGVGLDITGQKQSEAALRRSQLQYEQLVNSIDGIVWEGDAQTGMFTFVSPAAERMLGYPIESWLTERTFWIDRLHPDDRDLGGRLLRVGNRGPAPPRMRISHAGGGRAQRVAARNGVRYRGKQSAQTAARDDDRHHGAQTG